MKNLRALTAKELHTLDMINADRRGYEDALRVALNFHANQMAVTYRNEKDLWDHLCERMELDRNTEWEIKTVNNEVVVLEKNR